MSKVWKVIGILFGLMLLIGAVSIGVGMITGGDTERICDIFKAANEEELRRIDEFFLAVEEAVQGIVAQFQR